MERNMHPIFVTGFRVEACADGSFLLDGRPDKTGEPSPRWAFTRADDLMNWLVDRAADFKASPVCGRG